MNENKNKRNDNIWKKLRMIKYRSNKRLNVEKSQQYNTSRRTSVSTLSGGQIRFKITLIL